MLKMKEKKTLTNRDPRITWVGLRIMKYLKIEDELLIVKMLERSGSRAELKLCQLMDGTSDETMKIAFVYKTHYRKTFYKEVTIEKEVPKPKGATPPATPTDDESDASDEEEKKKKKDSKRKKSKGKKATFKGTERKESDHEESKPTEVEPEPEPEPTEPAVQSCDEPEPEIQDKEEISGAVDGPPDEDSDTDKSKKLKKEKIKPKKRPKSPASVVEVETLPAEEAAPSTITLKLKKIIKKEKELTQVHMIFGTMPPRGSDQKVDYVYFLLRFKNGIPIMETYEEACLCMPSYFYIGQGDTASTDKFISTAKILLMHIEKCWRDPFMLEPSLTDGLQHCFDYRNSRGPLPTTDLFGTTSAYRGLMVAGISAAARRSQEPNSKPKKSEDSNSGDKPCIRMKLIRPLLNFIKVLEWSLEQEKTEPTFKLPLLPELCRPTKQQIEEVANHENYYQFLETVVQAWVKYIDVLLKSYHGMTPEGKGPLPLYEYWALRCEQLSSIVDECYHPLIRNILKVLECRNSSTVQEFINSRRLLQTYYTLCSDNKEYLQCAVEEFKMLLQSQSLEEVTFILPHIADSLRVMWVLSSYWGSEPYFIELLRRIRWVICTKVTQILNVPQLFKMENEAARTVCTGAIQLMNAWKSSYIQTRNVIERTECEERWEFDRDLLFQQTEYISQVAQSLLQILTVVKSYEEILCPEMLETVKNSGEIDRVLHKLNDLTHPIVTADFDVFNRDFSENWKILLGCFWAELKDLESEITETINASFSDLRSCVKAANLLVTLKTKPLPDGMSQLLSSKFEDVVRKFSEEAKQMVDVFMAGRKEPPILRYHASYSGVVYWSRSVYSHLQLTVAQLGRIPDVHQAKGKSEAFSEYTNFVEMLTKFESSTYNKWIDYYSPIVKKVMSNCLIKITRSKVDSFTSVYKKYWESIIKTERARRWMIQSERANQKMKMYNTMKKRNIPGAKHFSLKVDIKAVQMYRSVSTCSSSASSSADDESVLNHIESLGFDTTAVAYDETKDAKETVFEVVEYHPLSDDITRFIESKKKGSRSRQKAKIRKGGERGSLSSIVDAVSFSLGDGVEKPTSEILAINEAEHKSDTEDFIERQHLNLTNFHTVYCSASSESSFDLSDESESYDFLDAPENFPTSLDIEKPLPTAAGDGMYITEEFTIERKTVDRSAVYKLARQILSEPPDVALRLKEKFKCMRRPSALKIAFPNEKTDEKSDMGGTRCQEGLIELSDDDHLSVTGSIDLDEVAIERQKSSNESIEVGMDAHSKSSSVHGDEEAFEVRSCSSVSGIVQTTKPPNLKKVKKTKNPTRISPLCSEPGSDQCEKVENTETVSEIKPVEAIAKGILVTNVVEKTHSSSALSVPPRPKFICKRKIQRIQPKNRKWTYRRVQPLSDWVCWGGDSAADFHGTNQDDVKIKLLTSHLSEDVEAHSRGPEMSIAGRDTPPRVHTGCRHDVSRYPWTQFMGPDVFIEHGYTVDINYFKECENVISEVELFDELGYAVPAPLLEFAIVKGALHQEVIKVVKLVRKYSGILSALKPTEAMALKPFMQQIELLLNDGITEYKWSSLNIIEYCTKVMESLNHLFHLWTHLRSIEDTVHTILGKIPNLDAFAFTKKKIYDSKIFFNYIALKRDSTMKSLVGLHLSLTPLMLQIESILFKKTTGVSSHLLLYYIWVENAFFQNLIEFVVNNLQRYREFLGGHEKPKFCVTVCLRNHQIVLNPSKEDIAFELSFIAEDLIGRLKCLVRWFEGTCTQVPVLVNTSSHQTFEFSFVEDVVRSPEIHAELELIYESIAEIIDAVHNYSAKWNRFCHLWTFDKNATMAKFLTGNPSLAEYDEFFSYYHNVIAELKNTSSYTDLHCVRIKVEGLIESLVEMATDWKLILGDQLISSAEEVASQMKIKIEMLWAHLTEPIVSLESFQNVLQAVNDCFAFEVEAELILKNITEKLHLLSLWQVPIRKEVSDLADYVKTKWGKMNKVAMCRITLLKPIIGQFVNKAIQNCSDFFKASLAFSKKFHMEGPGTYYNDLDRGVHVVEVFKNDFLALEQKRQKIVQAEKLFDLHPITFDEFESARDVFLKIERIFAIYKEQRNERQEWSKIVWTNFSASKLQTGIRKFIEEFEELSEESRAMPIGDAVKKNMSNFEKSVLLMLRLKNDKLRPRHWKELMLKTGHQFELNTSKTTLMDLFAMELFNHTGLVEEVISNAEVEASIEEELQKLSERWTQMELPVLKHYKCGSSDDYGYILGPLEIILTDLDHCFGRLRVMEASKFSATFKATIEVWVKKLSIVIGVLENWNEFQKNWLNFDYILNGSHAKNQLVEASIGFERIYSSYLKITHSVKIQPNMFDQCLKKSNISEIVNLSTDLEVVKAGVSSHLMGLRESFPRFFFLTDEDLIEILGSPHPSSVQRFILKMFDGVSRLRIHEEAPEQKASTEHAFPLAASITGLISYGDEVLEFVSSVATAQPVDLWMSFVVKEMNNSLKSEAKKAVYSYGTHYDSEEPIGLLGSTVLIGNSVWWTIEVENTFEKLKEGNHKAMMNYLIQINEKVSSVIVQLAEHLSSSEKRTKGALLAQCIQSRDTIEHFITHNVSDATEFDWSSRIRHYWMKEPDSLFIHQCSSIFEYGYEYTGFVTWIAATPLTERVQLSITQALSRRMGACVAGSAGAGKKEIIRNLSKTLGVMSVFINLSHNISQLSLQQIIASLCSCGVWGCFDKFDLLSSSALSIISTIVFSIYKKMSSRAETITMSGRVVTLQPTFSMLLTTQAGRKQRNPLPQSYDLIFRPIMCSVPDIEQICYLLLLSEGFAQAKSLSRKINTLFGLMKRQVADLSHYSFRLSDIKSVVQLASKFKCQLVETSEMTIFIEALRTSVMPRLQTDDVPYFNNLLTDMFPGICSPEHDLNSHIVNIVKKHYTVVQKQIEKIYQLGVLLEVSHSALLVGSTNGGKSVITEMYVKSIPVGCESLSPITYKLNPKALPFSCLYGEMNEQTNKWSDGLLASIIKELPDDEVRRSFIIFDGNVDPLWTECMSSLLNETKTLTLTNGERVKLNGNCSLIFEVGDLDFATPAIVARMAVLYVDPEHLGYYPLWNKWIQGRIDNHEKEVLGVMFNELVHPLLDNLWKEFKFVVPFGKLNSVKQLCYVLEAMLPIDEPSYKSDLDEAETLLPTEELKCVFIEALYCSLGEALLTNCRDKFDFHIREFCSRSILETENKKHNVFSSIAQLPSLYGYKYSRSKHSWMPWTGMVPAYVHDEKAIFNSICVPTDVQARTIWLFELFTKHNCEDIVYNKFEYRNLVRPKMKRPILLIGETGSGKTSIVKRHISNLSLEQYKHFCMTLTPQISSLDLQSSIESSLENISGNLFAPSGSKKLIMFIDDFNSAQVDQFGVQQAIAFLKLFIEKNGMFSMSKTKKWRDIKDVYIFGALTLHRMKHVPIDPRFLSLFSIHNVASPTEDTLKFIYTSILNGHFSSFTEDIKGICSDVIQMTLDLFKIVSSTFLATPAKFHYLFTIRNISHVVWGMLKMTKHLFTDKCHFLRSWRNEFTRSICDRLVTLEEQANVKQNIQSKLLEFFPDCSEYVLRDPILFGDFRNVMVPEEERFYEDLLDFDAVYHLFTEIVVGYNRCRPEINLVLFEDALEHLTRIHRVLRLAGGHAMILGPTSIGKKSIVQLASFAADCDLFVVKVRLFDKVDEFKNSVKKMLLNLSVKAKSSTLLLTSERSVDEVHLEMINNLITCGSIPSLFTSKESKTIFSKMSPPSPTSSEFLELCQTHVHVILSVVPDTQFKRLCLKFPGILYNSYIDWMFFWPTQAFRAISMNYLKDVDSIPDEYKWKVIDTTVHIQISLLNYNKMYLSNHGVLNPFSPTHFVSFIKFYLKFIKEKTKSIENQCALYQLGLDKLSECNAQLVILNQKLSAQRDDVQAKSVELKTLKDGIEEAQQLLENKRQEEKGKGLEAANLRKIIMRQEADVDKKLNEALPGLVEAKAAVGKLNQDSIAEMSASSVIPEPVQTICECISFLRGATEANWATTKPMIEDPFFLAKLKEMDCDSISKQEQILARNHLNSSKRMSEMKQISDAGYGLLLFVESVLEYCSNYALIKPKMDKIKQFEMECLDLTNSLDRLATEMVEIELKFEADSAKCELLSAALVTAEDKTSLLATQLQLTNRLFNNLNEDQNQWKSALISLKSDERNVYGDCLLNSAFLNFTPLFDPSFRSQIIYGDWLRAIESEEIPVSPSYSLESQFIDENLKLTWISEGLSPDDASIQNGILLSKSPRFPIFLDPHSEALDWLLKKSVEEPKILLCNAKDFIEELVEAVSNGGTIIVKGFNFLCNEIYDLLEIYSKEGNEEMFFSVGDLKVKCNSKFTLYITLATSNPHLEASTYATASVINFSISNSALEARLLSLACECHSHRCEKQRVSLNKEISQNSNQIKALQELLLQNVLSYSGELLENFETIQTLDATKKEMFEVTEMRDDLFKKLSDINLERVKYHCLCERGASLFWILSEMADLRPIYHMSLSIYYIMFTESIKSALLMEMSEKMSTLTLSVYNYGCLGLFEEDRMALALKIVLSVNLNLNLIDKGQIQFFIGDFSDSNVASPFLWIEKPVWGNVQKLISEFPTTFGGLSDEIEENEIAWQTWLTEESIDDSVPSEYCRGLSNFDRLLLLKCFRRDKLFKGVLNYIGRALGDEFLSPPYVRLENVLKLCSPSTPLLFVVSPGTNAVFEFKKFCETKKVISKHICLGEAKGFEKIVLREISDAAYNGNWLMLDNCHLSPSIMSTVSHYIAQLSAHSEFKLWISTAPSSDFSIQLLSSSIRVVLETPSNLKTNLRNKYMNMDPKVMESCDHPAFKSIVYAMAFFHGIIQERHNFSRGWNANYEFKETDFDVCLKIISEYLNHFPPSTGEIPWKTLKCFIGEVIYGGRMDDLYDLRVLMTYIDQYFGEFLLDINQPFQFYSEKDTSYAIPLGETTEDYLNYIDQLPFVTAGKLFGFDSNVECQRYSSTINRSLKQLNTLKEKTTDDDFHEEFLMDIPCVSFVEMIDRILELTRTQYELEELRTKVDPSPADIFLINDLKACNSLISVMRYSLNKMKKAIKGEIMKDEELVEMIASLHSGQVPELWLRYAPPTNQQIGAWISHLERRQVQYQQWLNRGQPWIVWISGLHHPKAYLTAITQVSCRTLAGSLSEIELSFEVTTYRSRREVPGKPQTGCYLEGLYLDGARWNTSRSCLEQPSLKIMREILPIVSVRAINLKRHLITRVMKIPAFMTDRRIDQLFDAAVFELTVPIMEHESYWILRRVSVLFTNE